MWIIKGYLEYLYQFLLVEHTIHSIHKDNICKQFLFASSSKAEYGVVKKLAIILQLFMDLMSYLDDFRPRIVSIAHF